MLGRFSCALGALFVAATMGSCGPPPPPLGGSITYNDSCTGGVGNMGVTCTGLVQSGANGETAGSIHKLFACFISPMSGGGSAISFRVGTTTDTSSSTPEIGMAGCGVVAGPGADLTNGSVTLYFSSGASAMSVPLTGGAGNCELKINSLTPTGPSPGFSGQIHCGGVADNGAPPVAHTITGATGQTMDPNFGDFEFHTCSTTYQTCTVAH